MAKNKTHKRYTNESKLQICRYLIESGCDDQEVVVAYMESALGKELIEEIKKIGWDNPAELEGKLEEVPGFTGCTVDMESEGIVVRSWVCGQVQYIRLPVTCGFTCWLEDGQWDCDTMYANHSGACVGIYSMQDIVQPDFDLTQVMEIPNPGIPVKSNVKNVNTSMDHKNMCLTHRASGKKGK